MGRDSFDVPGFTRSLLFVSDEDPAEASYWGGLSIRLNLDSGEVLSTILALTEPSTIFTRLPIRRPREPAAVEPPGYYPTYGGLSTEQRWVYLSWLEDVNQVINISYVFLYFYGLERHLVGGNIDGAISELLRLGRAHQAKSFESYSRSAVLNACILRRRPDLLKAFYQTTGSQSIGRTELRVLHELGIDLAAHPLAELGLKIKGVNRRYLKEQRSLYEETTERVLQKRYGMAALPFGRRYDLTQVPRRNNVLFANISFPSELRAPALPDFLEYYPFLEEVRSVLAETHEAIKASTHSKRTAGKRPSPKPPQVQPESAVSSASQAPAPPGWDLLLAKQTGMFVATNSAKSVDGLRYTDQINTITELKRAGLLADAAVLLARAILAVEAEAARKGQGWKLAPWYYMELAIVYRKMKYFDAEVLVLNRYLEHPQSIPQRRAEFTSRLAKARELSTKI